MTIDSFDGFVGFMFSGDTERLEDENVAFSDRDVLGYYCRLFLSPEPVLARYTRIQIDRGFAASVNTNVSCALPLLLSGDDGLLDLQLDTIASTVNLYKSVFSDDGLFGTPFMWWDSLIAGLYLRGRPESDQGEILRAIFLALVEILSLDSPVCQKAALHGLNHLRFRGTSEVVREYMRRTDISPELREYAAAAELGILP